MSFLKKSPFVNDSIFINALKKFVLESNFSSDVKDKVLKGVENSVSIFGNLKLKQSVKEIQNGSMSSLSKGGVYRRTTEIEGFKFEEIIKVFRDEHEAKRVHNIESVCKSIGLRDLVVNHSYSLKNVNGYLFEGDDLQVVSEDMNDKEKEQLAYDLFKVHLKFARAATDNRVKFNSEDYYHDDSHTLHFDKCFIQRFSSKSSNLEGILDSYEKEVSVNLNSLEKFMQHADPKFSNAVSSGDAIKLIDPEYVSDSPIHKLVYWFWDRNRVSLENIYDILKSEGFVDEKYNYENFISDFNVMRTHEDLLNSARCYELSKKSSENKDKYVKLSNYYFNRGVKDIQDESLKKELSDFVCVSTFGDVECLDEEKYKVLENSITINDRQLSRFIVTDFETYSDKLKELQKIDNKRQRGKWFKRSLGLAGLLLVLGGLGTGAYYRSEYKFNKEINTLDREWSRDHLSLKNQNVCEILQTEEYKSLVEKYGDKTIALGAYFAPEVVNKIKERFPKENFYKIQKYFPNLLEQELKVFKMSGEGEWIYYRDWVFFISSEESQVKKLYPTFSEEAKIFTRYPCECVADKSNPIILKILTERKKMEEERRKYVEARDDAMRKFYSSQDTVYIGN